MAGEGGNYFVDYKRGEVIELKNNLRNVKIQRDKAKMRDVIKKVVAYMTLGIDVSSLFSEMIMATHTDDMVQRKLVYLYLCTYAAEKPDVSLLAVNTLQRDCADDDPMVRGLALRSLCSLRVPNLVEYVLRPIRSGLGDHSGYVRKVAVLGITKINEVAPEAVKGSDLIDILYNMLKDNDTAVAANAISTLDELLKEEGGMAVNDQIVLYLLNRIEQFRPWGQCKVLDLCARYKPPTTEKIFDVMDFLDDRLRQSNSAVVLATINVFLKYTIELPDVHQRVYERIKEPLITHMSSPNAGVSFSVLSHIVLLTEKNSSCFSDKYKQFFCRFNDSPDNKKLKLKILTNIAKRSNASEIMNELAEYVTDHHEAIYRGAVRAIADIAVRVSTAMEEAMEHLLSFLQLSKDAVVAETLVAIKNVLRKYPNVGNVLPALRESMKSVSEEEAKCAVIFLLGAHGNDITDAPYILENFIDSWEEQPHPAKLELIPASVNLFFKRPPEMQDMLGRMFSQACEDPAVDIRDRAFFHYTLLQNNVEEANSITQSEKIPIDHIHPPQRALVNRLFEELNSLSVVYHKPETQFVRADDEEEFEEDEFFDEDEEEDDEEEEEDDEDEASPEEIQQAISIPTQNKTNITTDLLNIGAPTTSTRPPKPVAAAPMDDFLGIFGSTPASAPSQPAPAHLSLRSNTVKISQTIYQQKWTVLPHAANYQGNLKMTMLPQFQTAFEGAGFTRFASGKTGNDARFYLLAQESQPNEEHILGELLVNVTNGSLRLTLKSSDLNKTQQAKDIFVQTISHCLDAPGTAI